MHLDIHSVIKSPDLCVYLEEEYPDVLWNIHNVARLLASLYREAVPSGCPSFDGQLAIKRQKNRDYVEYMLVPHRDTYIWLGELRERLQVFCRKQILKEYRYRAQPKSWSTFPGEVLHKPRDPGDFSDSPISPEILVKTD
jgi:hypothetical protein